MISILVLLVFTGFIGLIALIALKWFLRLLALSWMIFIPVMLLIGAIVLMFLI